MRRTGKTWRIVAGAGVLISVVSAAGAAGAIGSHMTLQRSQLFVTFGQSAALTGRDTAQGKGIAHSPITVQANEFPFKSGFHTIASGQTDASGHYRIKVRPTHATRYRVSSNADGATSPMVTVYAVPRDRTSCNLCILNNAPGNHTLIVGDVYQFPSGAVGTEGPEYFYYGQHNGSPALPARIKLVKTVPLRHIKGNKLQDTVHFVVNIPATVVSRFVYVTCYKDAEAQDGIGLPGHHHCGDPTLTRAQFSGYLG